MAEYNFNSKYGGFGPENIANQLNEENEYIAASKEITYAKIIDTEDPDKKGRVKIRVIGVHATDTKKDDLPWVNVLPGLGTNAGYGDKNILQKGQIVQVDSLTPGGAEWIVTGGSSIVQEEQKDGSPTSPVNGGGGGTSSGSSNSDADGTPFSADAQNAKLQKEMIPKILSTIMEKLKKTLHALIMAKLLKKIIGSPGGPTPPEPPTEGYDLIVPEIDFTWNPVDRFGKNLGSFIEKIKMIRNDQEESVNPSDIKIELIPEEFEGDLGGEFEPAPGKILGFNLETSNPEFVKLENNELIIPPNVDYGEEPDEGSMEPGKIYIIKYKVINEAGKEYENIIKIKVVKELLATISFKDPELHVQSDAKTPQYKLEEHPSDSPKGQSENKAGKYLPNGMSMEYDGSDDNAYYAIKHPSGSRFDLHHSGNSTWKSTGNMQILTESNMHFYTNSQMEIASGTWVNIKSPNMYFEGIYTHQGNGFIYGDYRIEGNVTIIGDVEIQGNLHVTGTIISDTDVLAQGISLKNHVHPETGAITKPPMWPIWSFTLL